MRKILLLPLILISFKGYCQDQLGQTKAYIIKQNKECYISENSPGDDGLIVFECDQYTSEYLISSDTKLCILSVQEFPKKFRNKFISDLLDKGYKYNSRSSFPIRRLVNDTIQRFIPADAYTNGIFAFTILDGDLSGDINSGKIGIAKEYCTPKTGCD